MKDSPDHPEWTIAASSDSSHAHFKEGLFDEGNRNGIQSGGFQQDRRTLVRQKCSTAPDCVSQKLLHDPGRIPTMANMEIIDAMTTVSDVRRDSWIS